MVVRTRVVKLHLINPKTTICSFDNEVDVKIYQGSGSYMHNAGRMTEWCRAQSQTIFVTEMTVKLYLYSGKMTIYIVNAVLID